VLAGRLFDSTKRFSCDVLAKNSSYFPIGLMLELRNRLEAWEDLCNELDLVNSPPILPYLLVLASPCRFFRSQAHLTNASS
jgi:hypothetical protein